jgi:hypothetical protein
MKFSFIILLLISQIVRADVYKSVTGDGEVIFSDVPSQGAERVRLPELTTYKSAPVATSSSASGNEADQAQEMPYKNFTVVAPEDQASFWDNEGIVNMSVSTEPALLIESGHKVQFYLDGKPYGNAELSLANTFSGLERGTHILSASILDVGGTVLISTNPVTIHLHKASSLHSNNPHNRP